MFLLEFTMPTSGSPTRFLLPISESIIEMPLNVGIHVVVEPKLSDTQIYNEVIDVQNIKTGYCKNHRFLSFTATPPLGGSSKFRKRIFIRSFSKFSAATPRAGVVHCRF